MAHPHDSFVEWTVTQRVARAAVAMDKTQADKIFQVMRTALVGREPGPHSAQAFRITDVILDELTESGPAIEILFESGESGEVSSFGFSAFPREYGSPVYELPTLAFIELEEEINERYTRGCGDVGS